MDLWTGRFLMERYMRAPKSMPPRHTRMPTAKSRLPGTPRKGTEPRSGIVKSASLAIAGAAAKSVTTTAQAHFQNPFFAVSMTPSPL